MMKLNELRKKTSKDEKLNAYINVFQPGFHGT